MPPQIWGHEFFFEHPSAKLLPKVREAWTSDKLDRKKAFCFRCYDAYFREEVRRDQEEVHNQTRAAVRDKETIDAFLWSDPTKWTTSRQETIHRHLRTQCMYQPQSVRDQATIELVDRNQIRSPGRPRTAPSPFIQNENMSYIPPLIFASASSSSRPSPLSLPVDTFSVPFPSPSGSFSNVPSSSGQTPSPLLLTNSTFSNNYMK